MTALTARRTPVLADLVSQTRTRDAALVVAGAALLAVLAQVSIPLWFTPVPLTLSTFAVLLVGAALGPLRGGLSVGLYAALGVAGLPLFADQGSGWAFAAFGYVLGYLPAALLVGWLARRRADRSPLATAGLAAVGSLTIYAVGVPWLMGFLGVDPLTALQLGVVPFLVGDLIKTVAAAALLPTAWTLVDRSPRRR